FLPYTLRKFCVSMAKPSALCSSAPGALVQRICQRNGIAGPTWTSQGIDDAIFDPNQNRPRSSPIRWGHERSVHAVHGDRRIRSEDRKSTRLNSSHVSISYAVFCLKK